MSKAVEENENSIYIRSLSVPAKIIKKTLNEQDSHVSRLCATTGL